LGHGSEGKPTVLRDLVGGKAQLVGRVALWRGSNVEWHARSILDQSACGRHDRRCVSCTGRQSRGRVAAIENCIGGPFCFHEHMVRRIASEPNETVRACQVAAAAAWPRSYAGWILVGVYALVGFSSGWLMPEHGFVAVLLTVGGVSLAVLAIQLESR